MSQNELRSTHPDRHTSPDEIEHIVANSRDGGELREERGHASFGKNAEGMNEEMKGF